MKRAVFLIALACPLHAELVATIQTTQGSVEVALQFAKAPQAVANFITLAQGTRPWVDSSKGVIRKEPFFNGIKIHRTANNGGFKFAQGGSPKGDGSDGPGYTFKDEFSPILTHVPYVFSMANSGPNSNGSQFFFTGSLPQPTFNNVHTIFGLVTDPASRTVVDAMITAGANSTIINSITISRTDPDAVAFNEHAQGLPTVFQPAGNLVITPGVSATWNFRTSMTTGDVLNVFRSHTMAANDWQELASHHTGIGTQQIIPASSFAVLDNALASNAFYNLSVASHPGSAAPSSLANRTMQLEFGVDLFSYQFNSFGSGGIATINPGTQNASSFSFNTLNFASSAHNVIVVVENLNFVPKYRYFLIKVGCDSATQTQIDGHHTIQLYDGFSWYPFESGLVLISR